MEILWCGKGIVGEVEGPYSGEGVREGFLKGRKRAQMRGYDEERMRRAVGEYSPGWWRGCSNGERKGGICFRAP
jgi:hypothetical protein